MDDEKWTLKAKHCVFTQSINVVTVTVETKKSQQDMSRFLDLIVTMDGMNIRDILS